MKTPKTLEKLKSSVVPGGLQAKMVKITVQGDQRGESAVMAY